MKNRSKKILCGLAIAVLSVVMMLAGIRLSEIRREQRETEELFNVLNSMISVYGEDKDRELTEEERLEALQKLKELNEDVIGWIHIDGTNIDYPVMQSSEDQPEFYLDHDFNREYNAYGVPFLDIGCTVGKSNNMIVYGHRMNTDMMFHEILYYEEQTYQEEHPVIQFDTLEKTGEYEVIAVFRYNTDYETFRYRKYTDMDMRSFREYLKNVHGRELYETGLEAKYGENLLTLSTCDYTYANGRFVVVAREVVE